MRTEYYREYYSLEEKNWWFIARREIISELLDKHLGHGELPGILDVGVGTGKMLELLNCRGKTTGVDYSDEAIEFCAKRGVTNVVRGDACSLPFKDNSFGLVCAFDLLEHVESDTDVSREFLRVLRKGGILLLTVPAFTFLWGRQDRVSLHKRRYRIGQVREILKGAAFTIQKLTYFNFILFPIVFLVRAARKLLRIKGEPSESDFKDYPYFINKFLRKTLSFERILLRYTNLPFGVSILCVAEK